MRTEEEIENAIRAIQSEIDRVPPVNAFGESNAEEIRDMKSWSEDLKSGQPYDTEVVRLWIDRKWSEICDITGES